MLTKEKRSSFVKFRGERTDKAKSAILFLIIISIASGILLLLTLPREGNQIPDVKITEFKWTSDWETPAGVQATRQFNVTIQNSENEVVDELVVEFKMLAANGSEIQTGTMFFGPGIIGNGAEVEPFDGMLNAGEVRTLRGLIGTD